MLMVIWSFFWSIFSRIRTEYGEILRISPYSVRMRENTDQKKLRIWTLFTQWVSDEVDFFHADKYKSLLQIDTMILMGMVKPSQSSQNSRFAMSLQYLKKEVRDGVDFLNVDKHQSFLQVDFNSLGIKLSYKVILSLFMGMIKHSQSTQSNKFTIPL